MWRTYITSLLSFARNDINGKPLIGLLEDEKFKIIGSDIYRSVYFWRTNVTHYWRGPTYLILKGRIDIYRERASKVLANF